MYQILIVDNEAIERKALKLLIEKNFEGIFNEIHEGRNGQEAIEIAQKIKPNIILMDIQMPVMNGLEATKAIKEFDKEIEIIILTAFDYFEYAKQAIPLNVIDYLLKPVSEEKLIEVINQTIQMVESKDEVIQLDTLKPMISNNLVKDIINATISDSNFKRYQQLLGTTNYQYFCMILEFQKTDDLSDEFLQSIQHKLKFIFAKVFIQKQGNKIVGIIYLKQNEVKNFENIIGNIVLDLNNTLNYYGDMDSKKNDINVGVSKLYNDKKGAKAIYHEAIESLDNKKYISGKISEKQLKAYPIEAEKLIYDGIIYGDSDKTENGFSTIITYLKNIDDLTLTRMSLKQLCYMLHRNLICKFGVDKLTADLNQVMEDIDGCQGIYELQKFIKEYIENTINEINIEDESNEVRIIEEAKLCIESMCFTKDCNLNHVAEIIEITPSYLSRLFKKVEGMNFKDHIIKIRMEKAKELLRTTKLTTKEICHQIGYEDPNYFSRAFKKYEGVPATIYARRMNKSKI